MKQRAKIWLAVALFCLVFGPRGQAGRQAADPADWSDAQKEEFLLNAEIGRLYDIGVGRSYTRRAELHDGVTGHDAHVQTIDEYDPRRELETGVELNFMDSYKFNIAAYRLDRLVNLNMVPVSVERNVSRDRAAVTWWVDDVQMMLLDYYEDNLQPPSITSWNNQMYHTRVFNELVYNTDANLGNFLITNDWDLALIDFTRAFRIHENLREPKNLDNIRIGRELYEGLRDLDFETLVETMEDFLDERQIRALLKRRDLIMENLEEQIGRRGEAFVIRG